MTTATKITYTSAAGDLGEFHTRFDDALARVRAAAGASYPNMIGGDPVAGAGEPLDDRSPIDTSLLLGRFAAAGPAEVDLAVRRAKEAQRAWGRRPWQERIALLRRAAELIRERKYDLAALMALEVGKNRLEAMGDAEESADLIDYYCAQVEEADGFVRPMGRITPIERNTDVLRPYGVFVCIAPFNFPLALSTAPEGEPSQFPDGEVPGISRHVRAEKKRTLKERRPFLRAGTREHFMVLDFERRSASQTRVRIEPVYVHESAGAGFTFEFP